MSGAGRAIPPRFSAYGLGVVLLLLAGVALSSGGYLIRSIEAADGWQILFYRGLAFTATTFIFTAVRHKGHLRKAYLDIGLPGLIGSLALGLGFCTYLFAMLMTTVANVVFILSAGPFAAALMGRLVLGERVPAVTWAAMVLALAGIDLMMIDGLESGGWLGNLVALLAPISFAVMVVAVRKRTDRDMTPMLPIAGLIASLIALPMVGSLALSPHDLLLACLLGAAQIGLGFILITLGARWVPAAQVPLLTLTETVLAPIWVWLAFAEAPASLALLGGLVVLGAVLVEAIAGIRRERRADAMRS
jgi:drug/metabolite transporter (DMT)-like permease